MAEDWQALTRLTGGAPIEIERVRLVERDIHIDGHFELPPLACLSGDDQVFVAAFVRSHGSIKQMEKDFGISYPTVKNRLNRIAAQLPLVEISHAPSPPGAGTSDLLDRLERGELSAADVVTELRTRKEQGQ